MIIERKLNSGKKKLIIKLEITYTKIENKQKIVENDEYDEKIWFYHSLNLLRKFEFEENSKNFEEFPLLFNNEFIFGSGNQASIETDKNLGDLNKKEILQTVITRVKQFSGNNDNTFKELFLDNLKTYAEKIGIENTVDIIIPVLSKIPDECYSIKLKFLQIFPIFLEYLKSLGEKAYKVIRDDILKLIIEIFNDKKDSDLIHLASNHLIEIAKILNNEDRGTYILSTILGFANDDNSEFKIESRCLAAKLFSDLAVILGKDYCEQYLVPQIIFLSDDPHFKVRKAVASSLINISKIISYATFLNKILPVYKTLCSDTLWTVRKVCVEILPEMMTINKEKSNYESKNQEFIKLFDNFTLDSQKYVRASAIEVLGQFIYQLEKNELDDKFFNFYKNSAEEYFFNVKEFGIETESNFYNSIIYNCAFNFPAVLYCYGEYYWPKLRELYCNLADDVNENVKKSIINSFHEVAKILGPKILESDLLIIYDGFLSQKNEDVKNHAIQNLSKLLLLMNKEKRQSYIKYLQIFDLNLYQNQPAKFKNDWRKRIEILKVYQSNYQLFDLAFLWNKFIPLCIQFTFDDVFIVRHKSGKVLSQLFKFLIEHTNKEEDLNNIYKILESYALSQYYRMRIVFVSIAKYLITNENVFHKTLKNLFHKLIYDNIIDTRVAIAKMFSKFLVKKESEFLLNNKDFNKMCFILSKDKKISVRQYFCDIKLNPDCKVDKNDELEKNIVFDDTMEHITKQFPIVFNFNFLANKHTKIISGDNLDEISFQDKNILNDSFTSDSGRESSKTLEKDYETKVINIPENEIDDNVDASENEFFII